MAYNNGKSLRDLKAAAKELENNLPFMEGREKGDMKTLIGKTVNIIEYGFLKDDGKDQDYAVFVVAEEPGHFFFGGQVITDALQSFEADGFHETIANEGLPVAIGEKISKNKRPYTTAKFFPEEQF